MRFSASRTFEVLRDGRRLAAMGAWAPHGVGSVYVCLVVVACGMLYRCMFEVVGGILCKGPT